MGNYKKTREDWYDDEEVEDGEVNSSLISRILSKCIDVDGLYTSDPSLFSLDSLSIYDKIKLLKNSPKRFQTRINIAALSASDRANIILSVKNKGVINLCTLTDTDLGKIFDTSQELYFRLINTDFEKYVRLSLYKKMNVGDRTRIFIDHPEWVVTNDVIPISITRAILEQLSYQKPTFIDKYILDLSQHCTSEAFWSRMIKHDTKYKEIFLKNTKTCMTKTDVRRVISEHPDLIKMLDGNVLGDSKLTCKEWVLLINQVMNGRYKKQFIDWEFSEEISEIFKQELTVEMLTGKSKVTRQFKNSMKMVFGEEEQV